MSAVSSSYTDEVVATIDSVIERLNDEVAQYEQVKASLLSLSPNGKTAKTERTPVPAKAETPARVKRGRGRPRKSESEAQATPVKRGRGRPRKTDPENIQEVKRGPGRPRKTDPDTEVKRGPGRPRRTDKVKRTERNGNGSGQSELVQSILTLDEQGMSPREISEELDCSRNYVYLTLRNAA